MTAPGLSVMVVTDASWIENDVRASLTDPGTLINREADPRLAVAAAGKYDVNVAVIDLQVGSKGGMAVVRALRAAVESGDIDPVRTVLLLDRSADQFLAHRAGADAALVKPFTAQDLRAAIAVPAEV